MEGIQPEEDHEHKPGELLLFQRCLKLVALYRVIMSSPETQHKLAAKGLVQSYLE